MSRWSQKIEIQKVNKKVDKKQLNQEESMIYNSLYNLSAFWVLIQHNNGLLLRSYFVFLPLNTVNNALRNYRYHK